MKTNWIIQKIKSSIPSIVLAVVIATAFFVHMSIPPIPEKFNQAKASWEAVKTENAEALNAIKQLNFDLHQGKITSDEFLKKQPSLVEAYSKINKKKNELHKAASEIKSQAKVLHFSSLHFFLAELGWAVGLFLYALANLFNTIYLQNRYMRREFTGKMLLHSTLLFVGCFYTFYVFYTKDDFSKEWYILSMVLCTVTLVFASKFIIDTYIKRTEYLRGNIQRLIAFIFRIRNKHYIKVSAKALYAETQDAVINKDETVEDNNKEFDEDFYQTLHKIEV